MKTYFLQTGELIFSKQPLQVSTILGSCVGIAIFDLKKKIGGMIHYLLPDPPLIGGQKIISVKYGSVAIMELLRRFQENGSNKSNLIAHVAGGALILDVNEIFFVGERNALIAHETLEKNKIHIVQEEVGGQSGRRMSFNTHTGKVTVDFIRAKVPE